MQTYSSNLDAIKAIKRLIGLVIRVTPYDLVAGVTVPGTASSTLGTAAPAPSAATVVAEGGIPNLGRTK